MFVFGVYLEHKKPLKLNFKGLVVVPQESNQGPRIFSPLLYQLS